jgi:hypothetical protein
MSMMCIENDILENIDFNDTIMILPRRNVEKHLTCLLLAQSVVVLVGE